MEVAHALLTTERRVGVDAVFSFGDFARFLSALSPNRVSITFGYDKQIGSVVDIQLTFDGATAAAQARLFSESLIRAETGLECDCQLLRSRRRSTFLDDWMCLQVEPDVACLPGGKEIAVLLPLADVAAEVFRQARVADASVAYRTEFTRRPADAQLARALVPALADLRRGKHRAQNLEESIAEAFDMLRSDGWSVRERICVPASLAAEDRLWIEGLVRANLRSEVPFFPDDLLKLRWDPAKASGEADSLQKIVSKARSAHYLDSTFDLLLPSDPNRNVLNVALDQARQSDNTSSGDFAFISYAHNDDSFTEQVLGELNKAGVQTWVDRRLQAGSIWDEELENRIRNCGALIAFVSDEYQLSKYCRRELKFADVLGKSILPISSDTWTWGPGLQLMFQELQVASYGTGRGFSHIRESLRSLAPQVFS